MILWVAASACGDDAGEAAPAPAADAGDASSMRPDAHDAATGPREDAGGAAGMGAAGSDAGADGGPRGDGGRNAPDAAPPAEEFIPLPEGSRVVDEVVNLVDEEAASELEDFITKSEPKHIVLRHGLARSVNLFLEHYEEQHDFIFVFTDHEVPNATKVAAYEPVNRPAAPGGGNDIEIALGGFRTTGRVRGTIGVQWRRLVGPPLAHELAHEWAVHLDLRLGFSTGLAESQLPHWGFTGVYGQLGGFDAATLKCETPAGANPPGCTAGTNGRTRYVVGQFGLNGNASAPYAPLELYLMGLLPRADVPAAFQVLDGAAFVPNSFDQVNRTVVVEADGISQIAFADIIERHGEIDLLADDDRHYSAAFVVVSSEPASDEVMEDVAEWAAAFGNRGTSPVVTPFETLTGGRATLDTTLGPRRKATEPAPEPRERFECDLLAQDCPRPELACYRFNPSYCALTGGLEEGQPCDTIYACGPGLDCFSGPSDPDTYLCTPYCDPDDETSELACAALCPGMQQVVLDSDGNRLGAVCLN